MEKLELNCARAKLEDVVPLSAPFVLFLDPCGVCNFKCKFCPCNISDIFATERHKIMDWSLFEKIVDDLLAFDEPVKVIALYGYGEPLLNPRIADMVRILKEKHCCREIRIDTNGSLMDKEMSKALIDSGVDLVRVSVEALSNAGYKELCGIDIEFSKIYKNVETFYHLSRESSSKITARILSPTLKTDEDQEKFYDLFSPISDYHYIEAVEEYWPEFEEMENFSNTRNVKKVCYESRSKKLICSDPFTRLCIHSNGVVGACNADWKFAVTYGDVNYEHLTDIWNGEKHIEFQLAHLSRQLSEKFPFCDACMYLPLDPIHDVELLRQKLEEYRKKRKQ